MTETKTRKIEKPLLWNTIDEAVAWLSEYTGELWTARRVIDAAMRVHQDYKGKGGWTYLIKVALPHGTELKVYKWDHGFVRAGSTNFTTALLTYPMLDELLVSGATTVSSLSSDAYFLRENEYVFFDPLTVTLEMLGLSEDGLYELLHGLGKLAHTHEDYSNPIWYKRIAADGVLLLSHEPQEASQSEHEAPAADEDDDLSNLFDPVGIAQIEAMFPTGKWRGWADRKREGLGKAARVSHGNYNPYLAVRWWLHKQQPPGITWEKCLKTLAKNLPDRSIHMRGYLTGNFD